MTKVKMIGAALISAQRVKYLLAMGNMTCDSKCNNHINNKYPNKYTDIVHLNS